MYKTIEINYNILGMCLWNNNYIIASANDLINIENKDFNLKIININTSKEKKNIRCDSISFGIKKVYLKNYGEAIIASEGNQKCKLYTI